MEVNLDVNTLEGYYIAAALRGPDVSNDMAYCLKLLFTARIRNAIGIINTAMPLARDWDELGTDLLAYVDEKKLGAAADWLGHFVNHAACAIQAIIDSGDQSPDLPILLRAARIIDMTGDPHRNWQRFVDDVAELRAVIAGKPQESGNDQS
jgi:hypothetical protein